MLIIFDIDGTIIADTLPIIFRPYVSKLLKYCFDNFEVGIWTAATEEHAIIVIDALLTKEQRARLKFVLHRNHCLQSGYDCIKNLEYVFDTTTKMCNGWHQDNVLIIDDTPATARLNMSNAIIVKSYKGGYDNELKRLKHHLKMIKRTGNIRIKI